MFSIIVPACNAANTLGSVLEGLLAQTLPREVYEILVVDDGSCDDTAAIAQKWGVTVLQQPHAGAAAARNAGVKATSGEIVLFLDADCVPAPDWIESMTRPFEDQTVAGVSGVECTRQKGIIPTFIQMEYDYRYARMRRLAAIDFVDSGTAAYRRGVFEGCGGFDTAFLGAGAEDVELSFRLAEQGCRMILAPEAIVYHFHPQSVVGYARRKFVYAYWRAIVYTKYPHKAARDSRTPESQKLQVGLSLLIIIGAVGMPFTGYLAGGAAIALILFLVSAIPFVGRYWRRNKVVAALSPILLWVGAIAVGLGMIGGILSGVSSPASRK